MLLIRKKLNKVLFEDVLLDPFLDTWITQKTDNKLSGVFIPDPGFWI
jgi:hypothetical protein